MKKEILKKIIKSDYPLILGHTVGAAGLLGGRNNLQRGIGASLMAGTGGLLAYKKYKEDPEKKKNKLKHIVSGTLGSSILPAMAFSSSTDLKGESLVGHLYRALKKQK